MLVRERMTRNPVLCSPDLPVNDAFDLMKKERIRRLPVVDKNGKLVGIVSDKDLLRVSPSPATTLSAYEIPYLLSKVKAGDVMTKQVITVSEDTPIENAARIMVDNKIGGLPVVNENDVVVGIITETDILGVLVEVMGIREPSVRIEISLPDRAGALADVTRIIKTHGVNISSIVTMPHWESGKRLAIIRLRTMNPKPILKDLAAEGYEQPPPQP